MDRAPLRFALNHMVAPQLALGHFLALTRALGLDAVEIRNDLAGRAILDGTPAREVAAAAEAAGVEILSINALQKFNHWSEKRAAEAVALADFAQACGAKAVVLVAANDGAGLGDDERVGNAVEALGALKPILEERGLVGFVECLGFAACSLRLKSEAVEAIETAGGRGVFALTHDTFHHHLAGEAQLFPQLTGLIHISGVDDPSVAISDMRDGHRLLVGPGDRLGNLEQIAALRAAGVDAPLSFEPFAAEVARLADPRKAISSSMEFVRSGLLARAA